MRRLHGQGLLADANTADPSWFDPSVASEHRARIPAAIAEAIRAERPFDLEDRVRRADRTVGWVHARAIPLVREDGAATDGSARKIIEEGLRSSQGRARSGRPGPRRWLRGRSAARSRGSGAAQ